MAFCIAIAATGVRAASRSASVRALRMPRWAAVAAPATSALDGPFSARLGRSHGFATASPGGGGDDDDDADLTSGGGAVRFDRRRVKAEEIVRFDDRQGGTHFGALTPGETKVARLIARDERGGWVESGETAEVARLLPPIEPAAIFCIGLNYHKHAAEVGAPVPKLPVVFMKPPSAVAGAWDHIVIPQVCAEKPEVDYEVELAVVIGRPCKNVSEVEALNYVLGYTVANDVTARRWQGAKGGGQWCRGKSFDTFLPLGPSVVPAGRVDPQNLRLRSVLNGKVMQESNTSDMIFSVAQIIAFLSEGTTLQPGTVILTGTPEGVGYKRDPPVYLEPDDDIVCEIDGIGTLRNKVISETVMKIRGHKH